MPNKYQLAFLATFISVFSALLFISNYLQARLKDAGYDISNLILYGLDDKDAQPHEPMDLQKIQATIQELYSSYAPSDLHAVEVPLLGTYDLVALTSSPVFIITSTIIVAAGIWSNILHTGKHHISRHIFSYYFFFNPLTYTLSSLGRTKPLDPNAWKEFPLEQKIKVSPNTAMYVSFLHSFFFFLNPWLTSLAQLPLHTP